MERSNGSPTHVVVGHVRVIIISLSETCRGLNLSCRFIMGRWRLRFFSPVQGSSLPWTVKLVKLSYPRGRSSRRRRGRPRAAPAPPARSPAKRSAGPAPACVRRHRGVREQRLPNKKPLSSRGLPSPGPSICRAAAARRWRTWWAPRPGKTTKPNRPERPRQCRSIHQTEAKAKKENGNGVHGLLATGRDLVPVRLGVVLAEVLVERLERLHLLLLEEPEEAPQLRLPPR